MNSNTYILTLFRGLLVLLTLVSLSCANKETTDDPETFQEAAEAEAAEGDLAEADDVLADDESAGLESLEEEGDKGMQELEDELAALDESADALLGEKTDDSEPEGDEQEGILTEGVGADDDGLAGLDDQADDEQIAALDESLNADSGTDDLGLEDDVLDELGLEDEPVLAETETPIAEAAIPAAEEESFVSEQESLPAEEPIIEEVAAADEPAYEEVAAEPVVVKSNTPVIPSEAFQKDGVLLNRFYFVRKGDNAQSISQLIYGSESRAGELAALNRGTRRLERPGTLIFYASPQSPSDTKIQSFYQEVGIQPEEYEVQRGEWLSLIAKNMYGDIRSWKELAVVNGLADPDDVSRGQKLFAYPSDLRGTQFASNQPVNTQPVAEPEPVIQDAPEIAEVDSQIESTPVAQADIPIHSAPAQAMAPKEMAPKEMPPKLMAPKVMENQAPSDEMDILALLQQHLLTIAFGGAIFLLLIGLLFVNKRRRSRAEDDFAEQDYVEPPKARRR